MFVLPDVASACIAGVDMVQVVVSITDFSEFTAEICYRNYNFALFYDI